jgi:hypothetical protein
LIFTSIDDIINDWEICEHLGRSDHNIIKYTLDIKNTDNRSRAENYILDYYNADFNRLRDSVADIVLPDNINPNEQWMLFKN